MKHSYFGRKFSRTKNERKQLFRNLARDLFLHGQIRTTLAKAKAIQPFVEKMITKAKKGGDWQKRLVAQHIGDHAIVTLLWQEAQTRFMNRSSGFTRIVKLGQRVGDGGEEVIISFVDSQVPKPVAEKNKEEKASQTSATEKTVPKPKKKKTTTKK